MTAAAALYGMGPDWDAGGWSRWITSCLLLFPVFTLIFLYLELSIMGGSTTIYFRAKEFQSSLPSSWEDCLENLSPDVTMRDFINKKPSSVLVYEKAGPAMGNLQSFVYSLGSSLVIDDVVRVMWDTRKRQGLFKSPIDRVKVRHSQGRKYDAVFYLDLGPASPMLDYQGEPGEGGGGGAMVPAVVEKPFDPAAFSFYDTSSNELLFWFNAGSTSTRRIGCKSPLVPNTTHHAVLLDPFPVHNYSSLLVPFFYEKRPQVLTQDVVEVALAFSSEFRSRSFRLIYNSLGATAAINHLHFKLWEFGTGDRTGGGGAPNPEDGLPPLLPIERAHFRILTQDPLPVFELEDYPLYALAFDVRQANPQAAAPVIQHFITYLLHHHIPHSLFLDGDLLFVIPRRPMPSPLLILPTAHPEVWGEVRVRNEHDFERITADEVGQVWRDLSLRRTEFEDFLDAVPGLGGAVVSEKKLRKRRRRRRRRRRR